MGFIQDQVSALAVSNLGKLEEKGFPGASSAAVEGSHTGGAIRANHANPMGSSFSWVVIRWSHAHGHLAEAVCCNHLTWLKLSVQTVPRGDAGL